MGEIIEFPDERTGSREPALLAALHAQLHVVIERSIPESDDILGHVVAVSDGWVAIARLSDRLLPDGWTFIPLEDVCSVLVDPDPDCFPHRALRARGLWPPVVPDRVELGSVHRAIETAAQISPLVTLFREFDNPDTCLIGAVVDLDRDSVGMRLITPQAVWETETASYDLDDVTRVECGGGYEEALQLAVALLPSSPRSGGDVGPT